MFIAIFMFLVSLLWNHAFLLTLIALILAFLLNEKQFSKQLSVHEGVRVLISGGSAGIGKELALHYSSLGCKVGIIARREPLLRQVQQLCYEAGALEVLIHVGDITDEEFCRHCINDTVAEWGGLDVLICNAGISIHGPFSSYPSLDEARRVMDVNYYGVLNLVHPALPYLKIQQQNYHGSVLCCVTSLAALVCMPERSCYVAAKAAVNGFCTSLQCEDPALPLTIAMPTFVASDIRLRSADCAQYNTAKMITPSMAARIIIRAIESKKRVECFTTSGRIAYYLNLRAWLPGLFDWMLRRKLRSVKHA
eukprot:GCRY01003702.1.p1 GENE.GCRY01003702.1~~GCRY01003702.1.p1  ORF type:complete len:308 (+),score=51.58 GCRY01003702.1:122-1045(+)